MFRDASRPGDNANPVGVDINIRGDVASACSDKLAKPQGMRTLLFPILMNPPFADTPCDVIITANFSRL